MASAPGYSVIERGPLVLAMSQRFNSAGDGWCYSAPVTNSDGHLDLKRITLKDSAGQAIAGWQMQAASRSDVHGNFVPATSKVTLVPFYDAGLQNDPYVAAFPLIKTLDSLPPRLGGSNDANMAAITFGNTITADSEAGDASATNAIDGNPKTGWRSAASGKAHWIEVKLAKRQRIGRITLRFGERSNHPVDFKVLTLAAGEAPYQVMSVKGCNLSDYYRARIEPAQADIVRLVIESSSGATPGHPPDAAINEIELYEH